MQKFATTRRQLHAHPELSGEEAWTAEYVKQTLREIGVTEIHAQFAQHSVLAVIHGKAAGKTVLFRSELDALPIEEANGFAHRSTEHGKSHKCGHDGHTATLLALAYYFVENPPEKGKILLIFQSAEETGAGAKAIMDSRFLDAFNIDYTFAYHNLPGYPLGITLCKTGIFTPSVESFNITLIGKPCHASEPAKGINPAETVAAFVQFMAQLHQPDKTQETYFVATPIHIHMGEKAYGVSAASAEIGYTIRTWAKKDLDRYKNQIVQQVKTLCDKAQLAFTIAWFEGFCANVNDVAAVEHIQKACLAQQYPYQSIEQPFGFGEDFGLFTGRYKGAMFGLGAGEHCPALHTANYDFPDELIAIGRNIFKEVALQILGAPLVSHVIHNPQAIT